MRKSKHKGHIEHKYLPEFVYGGIDGVITTFAIVAGVIGAGLSSAIVLILGFANLFADGFSMAASNYLSTKSQRDSGVKIGKLPIKTAAATFISFLVIGVIPLISFIIAVLTGDNSMIANQFIYSIILTGIAFLVIGYFRGEIVGKNKIVSCLNTLIIGGVAAAIAFVVGYLLRGLA